MKNLILLALMIFSGQVFTQTSLGGKVMEGDSNTGVGAVFANVALYKGTDLITGTQTDFDGFYNFSNLDAGTYDLEVSYVGFQTVRVMGMIVFGSKANKLDVKLGTPGLHLNEKRIIKAPVQKLSPRSGCLTSDQLKKLPTRRIAAIAANVVGISSGEEGNVIYMRGNRSHFYTGYDGPRIRGTLIPKEKDNKALEELLGGTPASEY